MSYFLQLKRKNEGLTTLNTITIICKVISIHPFFDSNRNEYVCIEFGIEMPKPPTVVSMPSNIPKEVSSVIPILTQIPKIFGQTKTYDKYSNRLILFLTKSEWESLSRKYQYGDEVELRIEKDGTIHLVPIK